MSSGSTLFAFQSMGFYFIYLFFFSNFEDLIFVVGSLALEDRPAEQN